MKTIGYLMAYLNFFVGGLNAGAGNWAIAAFNVSVGVLLFVVIAGREDT